MAASVSPKDVAKLIAEYYDMLGETKLPLLLMAVAQNPQDETVDLKRSYAPVLSAAAEIDLQPVRRALMGWLNSVWLCTGGPGTFASGAGAAPSGLFMWEMHTRIQKALVVAMVLEGRNLESFGAEPKKLDIPQSLVWLWSRIEFYREHFFPAIKEMHQSYLARLPPDYVALYTGRDAAPE